MTDDYRMDFAGIDRSDVFRVPDQYVNLTAPAGIWPDQGKTAGELISEIRALARRLSQLADIPSPVDAWREANGLTPLPGVVRSRCFDPSLREVPA